jgi:hypothetical protein
MTELEELVEQVKSDAILGITDKLDILRGWALRIDRLCLDGGIISSDEMRTLQADKAIIKKAISELGQKIKEQTK